MSFNPRKTRPKGRISQSARSERALFDLGFLEDDVLAHDRIVLLELELLGLGARVLLGDVEEAGVGAGNHLDQDRGRLGHVFVPMPRRANLWKAGKVVAGRSMSSLLADRGLLGGC